MAAAPWGDPPGERAAVHTAPLAVRGACTYRCCQGVLASDTRDVRSLRGCHLASALDAFTCNGKLNDM